MQGTQTALLPIDREVFELTLNIFLQLLTTSGYLSAALSSQVMAKKVKNHREKWGPRVKNPKNGVKFSLRKWVHNHRKNGMQSIRTEYFLLDRQVFELTLNVFL